MARNGSLGVSHFFVLGTLCSLALVACGGDNDSGGSSATGGAANSGGSTATGGSTSSGGGAATGGSSTETGGSTSSGGTTGSGGSSPGDAKYACMIAGEDDSDYATCIEYSGSESFIDTIRDASGCIDQGGTEPGTCPPEGAGVCVTSQGSASNSTFYYGLTADDVEVYTAICDAVGGTFTAP